MQPFMTQVQKQLKKKEKIEIPQLDGAADDDVVPRKSTRQQRKSKGKPVLQTKNITRSDEESVKLKQTTAKKRKASRRGSETVSKYKFTGNDSSCVSDENVPTATKISTMVNSSKLQKRTTNDDKANGSSAQSSSAVHPKKVTCFS